MTTNPFFSVIIPTYNRGNLISETLESVFSQRMQDFEIIVIDDCSTDNTAEVLKPLFNAGKIRYIKNDQNYERAVSRNIGILNAIGQYLAFIDSDDIMHDNHLSTLYSIIQIHPDIKFLATKYQIVRNNKTYPSLSLSDIREGWHDVHILIKGNPFATSFCLKKNNPDLKLFQEDSKFAVMEDWMFLFHNIINEKIFISGITTISLIDHDSRTMRGNNQNIISKKLMATEWIIQNLTLTERQINNLKGYAYYFCAIHEYIDDNKLNAIKYLCKTTKKIGIKLNSLMLLVKVVVGYPTIQKIKGDSLK
ncbi:MAG TPA: glycosyltransferase family 2 protein [Bacteroidia bacterium]